MLIIDLSPQIGAKRIKPGRADLKPFGKQQGLQPLVLRGFKVLHSSLRIRLLKVKCWDCLFTISIGEEYFVYS